MTAPADHVHLAVADGVATLTLAKVHTRNSIDVPMSTEIYARVQEAAGRDDVGVIVVRADGPAWSVGGAIDVFLEAGDKAHEYVIEVGRSINPLVATLHECDKITVAAVHGAVAGGGLGIMLAHDVVVAAEGTVLALGYSRIGTNPDGGNSYFLTRDVGYRRALELYLTNARVDAAQALELGMVNRVVERDKLDEEAARLAAQLARGPWKAHAAAKRLLRQAHAGLLARQLDDEIRMFADNTREADFVEGLRSFLEKRPPRFGAPSAA